jgi:excisionase family DNA binding protein
MKSKKLEVSVVASRLNVSPATVYRLIQARKLKAIRCGVKCGLRVVEASVDQFELDRANWDEEAGI